MKKWFKDITTIEELLETFHIERSLNHKGCLHYHKDIPYVP